MDGEPGIDRGIRVEDAAGLLGEFSTTGEAVGQSEVAGGAGVVVVALHVDDIVDRPAVVVLAVDGAEVMSSLLHEADTMHGADVVVRPSRTFGGERPLLQAELAHVGGRPVFRFLDEIAHHRGCPRLGGLYLVNAGQIRFVQEEPGLGKNREAEEQQGWEPHSP